MGITKETEKAIRDHCMKVLTDDHIRIQPCPGVIITDNIGRYDETVQRFLRKLKLRIMLECIDDLGFDIEKYLNQKMKHEKES